MDPTVFNPLDPNDEFIKNYRKSLQDVYDSGVLALENQRSLDQASIMNQANKAGVMFSNIPQRMKTQYDTQTYMPNLTNLRQTYQTGLDTLRNNSLNAINTIKYYQDMINHYNSLPTSSSNSGNNDTVADLISNAIASYAQDNTND